MTGNALLEYFQKCQISKPDLVHSVQNMGTNTQQNFTEKNNGRNEIFEKKMHGKEVSHDRATALLG